MKKMRLCFISLILAMVLFSAPVLAVDILEKDGVYTPKEAPSEPLVTPDPRAVKVGEREDLVENSDLEDKGTVWCEWSGRAYSKYGCTTAKIGYTNPTRSNIGVTLKMAIFDEDLVTYFGTTFRSEEEQIELANTGWKALQDGITLSTATRLVNDTDWFEGMTPEQVKDLSGEELLEHLSRKDIFGFLPKTLTGVEEGWLSDLDEEQRLSLAQLGEYNPKEYYQLIGEDGLLNPGYEIGEIDLYTLPVKQVLPKGDYDATFVLTGYMADKNEFSDCQIQLPVTLTIEEDLPDDLLEEYGLYLLVRIDQQ